MKKTKMKKKGLKRIHKELEMEVMREEKARIELEKLYEQMGTKREKVAKKEGEAQTLLTPAQVQEITHDPEKLTRLLIAIGPKEIVRLEKAVIRLQADPKSNFAPKVINDTVKKLREFSAELSKTARDIDEKFRRQQLIEQIKLEKEKQKDIQDIMNDLQKN